MSKEGRPGSLDRVGSPSNPVGPPSNELTQHEVRDPYRGDVVGTVSESSDQHFDEILAAAAAAAQTMAEMSGYDRAALLDAAADAVAARGDQIAELMCRESGKAIGDCLTEVRRAPDTLRLSGEEAVRIQGEHVPMDASAVGAKKLAMTLRFPVGVVAAITPFNAPVNLVAHKLGPALAAGNAIVVKPSPKAPLSAEMFLDAVRGAGAPPGAVGLLHGDRIGTKLVTDPRVNFVSFTGSIPVGRAIRDSIGIKRATLELGGVGPTIVAPDADLESAATACARHGMLLAGQSCASVQAIHVDHRIHDQFVALVEAEVTKIRFGDPLDPETEVGTMIDESSARRVLAMVEQAVDGGARLLSGGNVDGARMDATVVIDPPQGASILTQEAFGPVVAIQPYGAIESVFASISASPYGLQCGLFTNSLKLALTAVRSVKTGGLIINGTSRWRSDQMPYGGVGESGIGREGPKFAIREMTDERLVVFA